MADDVFYKELKEVDSPRGSIVPEGATTEEVEGEPVLRIPETTISIDTPIIFPGFRIIIEGSKLDISGETIVDAAIYGRTLEAINTVISAEKEIEVTETLRVAHVRGKTVRAERIEAKCVEADLNVYGSKSVIAQSITVEDGGVRTPILITDRLDGEDLSVDSRDWDSSITNGDVPQWLQPNS